VVITRNKFVGLGIMLLSLTSLAFAIDTAVVVASVRLFSKKVDALVPATVWLVASVLADALITASLYVSLTRRRTGFQSTDAIINRIIRLAIQTGLLTVVFALVETTIFLVIPNTTANFAVDFPLSKLYSNALLSTLNARMNWRQLGETQIRDGADDNILFGRGDSSGQMSNLSQSGLHHRVSTVANQSSSRYMPRAETGTGFSMAHDSYELQSRDDRSVLPIHVHKEVTSDSQMDKGSYQGANSFTQ